MKNKATLATYSFMVDQVLVAGGGDIPPVVSRRSRLKGEE